MALSDDQKAILRLLTQRGEQGYEDLSALMGIDAAKVHERAQAAAAQLESEGIPAPSIPPPPGSAAAAAPGEKVAAPEPQAPPAPKPTPVPSPEPAPTPAPAPAPTPPPPAAPRAPSPAPKFALPKGNGARAAIAAGVAVVVALVIALFVVLLVNSEGSDDKTGASGETTVSAETIDTTTNPKLTQAVLSPIDGGDAKGVATFGRVKNSLALQIEAEGLEPTAKGDSYTIWLYESADKMLPLASTAVGENGEIGAQVAVPTEVLAYLANETFDQLDVSLTTDTTLKASLAKATKEKKAPIYTGTDVLRGTITGPIIGAAKKAKK
jgi:hypothetical protein